MNILAPEWFADQIAGLTREVPIPQPPLLWGTDLSCTLDIPDDFHEVPADSYLAIGEALLRRIITPRGALADVQGDDITDADYGAGLLQMLNVGISLQQYSSIEQRLEAECRKDDRVDQVEVAVSPATQALQTGATDVKIKITPVDPRQTFELVLAVDGTGAIVDALVQKDGGLGGD